LGAGGSTDGFSRIGWARHVTMTKVAGTDGNSAAAGTAVTPDPALCLTLTHHGVSSPLGNEPVTFTVMTGAGTVGGGGLNAVTVNTDGGNGSAHDAGGVGRTPRPKAPIAGGNAGVDSPDGMALDGARNTYVVNDVANDVNSITVYAAGASGNATPTATIAGGNTGLSFPQGIALDGTRNIYVTTGNSIRVYAAGASGNATPTATTAGGNTGLSIP